MFIVFGSPRSGTTLLSTTLDLHDQIVIPRETDFIVPLALITARIPREDVGKQLIVDFVTASKYFPVSIGGYLSRKDIENAVQMTEYSAPLLLDAIYGSVARKAGKRLAGDKSPDDLNHIDALCKANVLPSACIKVIHIVRDVRDVMLSLLRVPWGGEAAANRFPRLWSTYNVSLGALYGEHSDSYCLVKYEDMVCYPRDTFYSLTNFLGVEFQESMLNHALRGLEWRHMEHHRNLQEPFLRTRVGAWQRELEQRWIDSCDWQAGEAMRMFGYR